MGLIFGIDLGGTKIEGVVMPDPETPRPLTQIRIPTEADGGYDHIISQVGRLITLLEEEVGHKCDAVGIGTPGSTNPLTGLMRNANTTCLNGMPFLTDLRQRLGREVRIANDANCFALAEAKWGAGKGLDTVFGVIMGTGVGGGLVVHGRVLNGANGIAGEWGHNVLHEDGPSCYCGKRGCVETFLSGPASERYYREKSGNALKLSEIARRAQEGSDQVAVETIRRLLDNFGLALSVVIDIFDPHVVVLGGGVGQMDVLSENGPDALRPHVFSDRFETPLAKPKLGDSAGVFGAALLLATLE